LMQKTAVHVADAFLEEQSLKTALAEGRVLIHCTPIGMSPKTGMSCVPSHLLHRGLTIMDIVYNPRDTQLLLDAKAAGCRTISGLEMFLYQAAAQFEHWTGQSAPTHVMRAVLESRLR